MDDAIAVSQCLHGLGGSVGRIRLSSDQLCLSTGDLQHHFLLCLLAPIGLVVVPLDHGKLLLAGILMAGFWLEGGHWFLCPANHDRTHCSRKYRDHQSISTQYFHHNSFFNLKVRI
jgi:hypothetical protein